MSGTMNICGLTPVDDPSYRYKMPCMSTKIEGRGNGIKTVLTNIVDVANSLNRDPPEVTKFFGCELGSQTTFSETADKGSNVKAVVNGAQTTQDMQNHLKVYIEKFVLCRNCHLPETKYKIKNGVISQVCAACGSKEPIDMSHKLTTFILAQHQKKKDEEKKKEKEEGKKSKKDKSDKEKGDKDKDKSAEGTEKKSKKDKSSSSSSAAGTVFAAVEKSAGADGAALTPEKKSKKSKKHTSDDEGEATGEGMKTVRSSQSLDTTNPSTGDDDDEDDDILTDSRAIEDGINRLQKWVPEHENKPHAIDSAEFAQMLFDELKAIQTISSLSTSHRYLILLGAVFTEQAVAKNEVGKFQEILKKMLTNNIQQRQLVAAFEWFCGTRCRPLLRYFPVILKQLYDEDLVEEDVLLQWDQDPVPNDFSCDASLVPVSVLEQLKQGAKPFITWLTEAEEEDEEGEDDEDVESD